MGSTTLTGLPWPEPTAEPFLHLDVRALAEAVDDRILVVCTSTTRPPHRAGRVIFETDTKREFISDGTVWRRRSQGQTTTPAAQYGTYTAGTPTRVCAGIIDIVSASTSLATVNLPSDFGAGLLSVAFTSRSDPNYQYRMVGGSSSNPNSCQVVVRTASGGGAGAVTASTAIIAVGWD